MLASDQQTNWVQRNSLSRFNFDADDSKLNHFLCGIISWIQTENKLNCLSPKWSSSYELTQMKSSSWLLTIYSWNDCIHIKQISYEWKTDFQRKCQSLSRLFMAHKSTTQTNIEIKFPWKLRDWNPLWLTIWWIYKYFMHMSMNLLDWILSIY